ncbi:alpha/beta fold hydrolase [Streptomyces sp. NPDC055078]
MGDSLMTEDGVRLWAIRSGRGEPVVFCHGGPGLWDTLGDLADMLADTALVHRWDQRGCGRSQRSGPYSVTRSVADLDAVREHFGLERMTLLGHSWGAQLALLYALEHPGRVSGLVYVSGTGIEEDSAWQDGYRRGRREALGEQLPRWQELNGRRRSAEEDREFSILQWTADFVDRERALGHARRMADPWFGVNFACNTAISADARGLWGTARLRKDCEALDVPTLIVDGAEDIRPRSAVDSLERALPRVSRIVLAGAGHLPWIEDPDGFRTAVRAFLADRP